MCINRGKKKVNLQCQSSEQESEMGGKYTRGFQSQPPLKNNAEVPGTECIRISWSDHLKVQMLFPIPVTSVGIW